MGVWSLPARKERRLKMRKMSCFLLAGVVVLSMLMTATTAQGAGFALFEGSARGNALGGALVARADDPSALFYNPAGMTQVPGLQLMGGVTMIATMTDIETTFGGTDTRSEPETSYFFPPHFYATYQYTDSVWFGLGIMSRYGLDSEFDAGWPGRYNAYNTVIQTLTFNPNIAFKVNDKLSLAGGPLWMWFDLVTEQRNDPLRLNDPDTFAVDVDQSLTGDSVGYGFSLAMHFKAYDWMSLGLSYSSQVKQEFEGEADFTKPSGMPFLDPFFNDTSATGEITLPEMVFLGVAFYPADRLSLEVSGVWTGWSNYDQLSIHYGQLIDPTNPSSGSVTIEKKWNDVWRLQIGAEYKSNDWLDLRIGYVWDNSPIPDETADYLVPANDRYLCNVGCGLHWGPWSVDLSYSYMDMKTRSVNARPQDGVLDSKYEDGHGHFIGSTLGYKF